MADRRIYEGDDISSGFLGQPQVARQVSPAYTTNGAPGDQAAYILYTVTGVVLVTKFFGICNVNLVGAATIDVGTTNDIDVFSPTILADATTWDAGEIWDGQADAATLPSLALSIAADDAGVVINATNATENIIETIGAADISAGQVDYYCVWTALTPGSSVVATVAG